MDTRTPERLPRQARGAAPQASPAEVLRDLGAPARPRISGEAQRGGEGGASSAVRTEKLKTAIAFEIPGPPIGKGRPRREAKR